LGLKIQHSLRAFTANDRQAIKLTAQNFPDTEFYETETVLTNLGIGEAFVTVLDEKGRPTPLAVTMMRAPQSRMDILTPDELEDLIRSSRLADKYNEVVDRESAYEILSKKIEDITENKEDEAKELEREKERKQGSYSKSTRQNPIMKVVTSAGFIRGVFGILAKVLK
jgi:hypothetical protein